MSDYKMYLLSLRYIISFLLDSTLGLVIIWASIRLSIYIGQKQGYPTIIFGEYGEHNGSLYVQYQYKLLLNITEFHIQCTDISLNTLDKLYFSSPESYYLLTANDSTGITKAKKYAREWIGII